MLKFGRIRLNNLSLARLGEKAGSNNHVEARIEEKAAPASRHWREWPAKLGIPPFSGANELESRH